ncbi:TatD DNase family protein [Desulfovibrionales bacterium]
MSRKKNKTPLPNPAGLGLPDTGVDTHAHLNLEPFVDDLDAIIYRARLAGVSAIGNVFLGPEAWKTHRHRFATHPEVFFLLGMHPNEARNLTDATLEAMADAFHSDCRLKALGEIGIDLFWNHSPREKQFAAFANQLTLARDLDLPVVIHCRDAVNEVLAQLSDQGFQNRPLLWHCFEGGADLAATILDNGWHLSVPGLITFSKNYNLRSAVTTIPLDRLMLETDCPYLAPAPYRGKRNEPALLGFVAVAIAEAKNLSLAEVWTACGDTACRFFGLPTS